MRQMKMKYRVYVFCVMASGKVTCSYRDTSNKHEAEWSEKLIVRQLARQNPGSEGFSTIVRAPFPSAAQVLDELELQADLQRAAEFN